MTVLHLGAVLNIGLRLNGNLNPSAFQSIHPAASSMRKSNFIASTWSPIWESSSR